MNKKNAVSIDDLEQVVGGVSIINEHQEEKRSMLNCAPPPFISVPTKISDTPLKKSS